LAGSAVVSGERYAQRQHWGVESMHWLLDVEFKEDLSRYRHGHGAKNMAIVRRFALGLAGANNSNDRQPGLRAVLRILGQPHG
jgi:predicted transposase YbfD/YdcC